MKETIAAFLLFWCALSFAQTAIVKDTVMVTYGFSDPDPVPRTDKVYPYCRYSGFSLKGEPKAWKMVVLENDFLRVKVFPEIGGKIWSVYDKKNKKELFYDNDVVKFREISLRGPWTSGGIEFNYGVIGHAPSCAHPVDYSLKTKDDGSVSCYIGVSELITRSRWVVEINLPKDAARVRTRSFWHNYSGAFEPYYSWANSGVTASDDLRFFYPADYSIGHNGQTTPFPSDDGHDLSKYSGQRFGADKSFHPGGSHKGYFGAYWADDDEGVLHYALRDEKLGRKYFSWAQSGQGDIWVNLLTDTRSQYVELQSGRLFNQNDISSVKTPYKQFLFSPYSTDEWNDYWFPFAGIGGVDDVTLSAVVNVSESGGETRIGIFPLEDLSGELSFKDVQGSVLEKEEVSLKAAVPFNQTYSFPSNPASISVGGRELWSKDSQKTDRPSVINSEFDLGSAAGEAIRADYYYGMGEYGKADERVDAALEKDPSLLDALNTKALLLARKARFEEAYDCSNKALAIDEYNPKANYVGGTAALRLGKVYDAMDRFEIAAITNELRSASCTRLAMIHFARGEMKTAEDYVRKSLIGNADNVTALEIQYQIAPSESTLLAISNLDPLCHFPDIERMLAGGMTSEALWTSIQEEMRLQNYLEYAVFYSELGMKDKAFSLLDAAKDGNVLTSLWKAYLKNDVSLLNEAESEAIDFVFPFRDESIPVLEWALSNGGGWKCRYLLAMLKDHLGDEEAAESLISGNDSDYAPYYAYRATFSGSRADIEKALSLDPSQWRYVQALALNHYDQGDYSKAVEISGKYFLTHKDNFHIGDTYVKSLIASSQYEKAEKVLEGMEILPFEGQSASHIMYRNIKLHLAVNAADKGDYKTALKKVAQSREWPESLGAGKPYDYLVDNRAEDWLCAVIHKRMGDEATSSDYLGKLISGDPSNDWRASFDKAVAKEGKRYVKLSSVFKPDSVPVDKKLF